MVPRSLGVSRSLVVLSSLGCYTVCKNTEGPAMMLCAALHTKEAVSLYHLVPSSKTRQGDGLRRAQKVMYPAAQGNVYGPAFAGL
jgi:hypothetical protein